MLSSSKARPRAKEKENSPKAKARARKAIHHQPHRRRQRAGEQEVVVAGSRMAKGKAGDAVELEEIDSNQAVLKTLQWNDSLRVVQTLRAENLLNPLCLSRRI